MSKAFLNFMRNPVYMDVVRDRVAITDVSAAFRKRIAKTAGKWTKWKMGTVAKYLPSDCGLVTRVQARL